MTEDKNLYKLLNTKEIIAILDGDTKCGKYIFEDGTSVDIAMPYLSGKDLCDISTLFGLPKTYQYGNGAENLSRWQYLESLIDFCVKQNRCSDLLKKLFSKDKFTVSLSKYDVDEIEKAYAHIAQTIIQKINGILYFGENELVLIGNNFLMKKINANVEIEAIQIPKINQDYIKSIYSRANRDIELKDYDSAITKSRTLLEETFCFVIERKNEKPTDSGDIASLFKQVKNLYNMHTDANADKRINSLISGLNSIVSAIAQMRNKNSDAHGVGSARINIEEHHARLVVNSATAMADFILSIEINSNKSI